MLQVSHLSKSYHTTRATPVAQVLHSITFSVQEGQTVALVGHSGSGKSTLLALLGGLELPDSGQVVIDDTTISTMPERKLATWRGRYIGFIFQQFHLLPYLTALDNVALPLDIIGKSNTRIYAQKALEMVGLAHRIHHLPHMLSGGECQRVAIARALVVKPKLLIADEPTGNLDSKNGAQVAEQLFALAQQNNTALIIATHSEPLAAQCDRILTLKDGVLQGVT